MYLELKRLDDLKASELGQVTTPFYAVGQLKSARAGYLRIRGFHEALESCTDPHGPWDWNYRERGFERLCAEVERGDWVLVLDKSWLPLSPAFLQVNGQWEVTRQVWTAPLQRRFTARARTLERKQREREALHSRNQPSAAAPPDTEPAVGPGNRAATLGPHAGGSPATSGTPAPSTSSVKTGLGDDVDQLASTSPSLQKDLTALQKDGWLIEYGKSGGGSYANRNSSPPRIVIDSAQKGDPAAVTQTLSHEVGHATYHYKPDFSSKSAYVNGALADEGAATMSNIKVQREILANGGPDIGIAGNSANHPVYNRAYDQFLKDGNAAAARQTIGRQFGNGEVSSVKVGGKNLSYNDYYGSWYDKAYPPKK